MSRRRLLATGAGAIVALAACGGGGGGRELSRVGGSSGEEASDHERGRLRARPRPHPMEAAAATGMQPLGLRPVRSGVLYVPPTYTVRQPVPLVVALHGAGGDASGGLAPLAGLADELGLLVLAPESRQATWDVLVGGYGPDVELIDRALLHAFDHYAADPARLIMAGFSDGASYALSLGITNGDLFSSVLAFSPGFAAPGPRRGSPRIFISHGTQDPVLRIDATSRKLVPRFRRAGHDLRYVEFEGGHTVPPHIVRTATTWALGLTP